MAHAFDTLAYAKRLRDGGIPDRAAEVHAEAAREFIMTELVTKSDLESTRRELETSIETVRRELKAMIVALGDDMKAMRREFAASLDHRDARLLLRVGSMLTFGFGIMAALIKL